MPSMQFVAAPTASPASLRKEASAPLAGSMNWSNAGTTDNDEIVVNEEGNGYDAEVAARVKDGMRERCLPQIADAWLLSQRNRKTSPK